MAKKPTDWLQLSQAELNAKASEVMRRPHSRLRINPDFDEFLQWLLDYYRDRIIPPHEIGEQERPIFRRAAAAYFYGCDSFDRLKLQGEPEKWDKIAGGELLRQLSEIMVSDRHGREVSVVKKRGPGPAKKYGTRLFVAVLAIEYERMTGRPAEPPALETHDHSTAKSRQFDQLCEKWGHLIDPDLPSPILSRTGYRKILSRT